MQLRFTKMHGIGNDYVYIDGFSQALDGIDMPTLARRVSDRHRGIGSDGLILILPATPGSAAHARMEMYNSDGSRGEMCGNGIRCVAKYVIERLMPNGGLEPTRGNSEHGVPVLTELNLAVGGFLGDTLALNQIDSVDLQIETDRGVLDLIAFRANGEVQSVQVDMGAPILDPRRIPTTLGAERCIAEPFRVGDDLFRGTAVSMGNPHMTIFVSDVQSVDLAHLGPRIEHHPAFPNRINVHFAACPNRGEVVMRTWERGAGPTQACGTGACAVLAAGVLENRLDRTALMHLPGGDLRVTWSEQGSIFMLGPAESVFCGEIDI